MPLTPAEVHNVAFKKPPIGKRGYDEEEVDAFLDIVEVELSRLIEENNDLRARFGSGAGAAPDASADGATAAPDEALRTASSPPRARRTSACRATSASWRRRCPRARTAPSSRSCSCSSSSRRPRRSSTSPGRRSSRPARR